MCSYGLSFHLTVVPLVYLLQFGIEVIGIACHGSASFHTRNRVSLAPALGITLLIIFIVNTAFTL